MISTPSTNQPVNKSIEWVILASRCLIAVVVIIAVPAIIKHSLDLYSISFVCVGISFFLLEFAGDRKILKRVGYFFAVVPVLIIGSQMYEFIIMEFFNYIDFAIMLNFILIACLITLTHRKNDGDQRYINGAAILNVFIALVCLRFSPYVAIELLLIGVALILRSPKHGFMEIILTRKFNNSTDSTQKNNRELFAAMLRTSSDAIITFTLDGSITSWSKAAEQIFDYSAKEAIGKNRTMLFESTVENRGLSVVNGMHEQNHETEGKKKDGSLVYLSIGSYPIRNSADKIVGVCEISRDITTEKDATNKLASSERRMTALIENISEGITLTDASLRVLFQSPSVTKILGYSAEERDGIPATDFVHSDYLEQMVELFKEVNNSPNKPIPFQVQIRHKLGHSIWVEGTLTNLLHDPDIAGFITNYRDITARKETENKLLASEIRFRALIENSSDGIVLTNAESDTIYRSPAASRIAGFGTEEKNKHVIDKTHPDDLAVIRLTFQEVLKNPGIAFPFQGRFLKADGEYFWLEGTLTNLLQIRGINAIVTNFHDVSERKKAADEIIKLNHELEEKVTLRTEQLLLANKELEAFSYSVSHDLRAPLRIINGFSEILLEDHQASLDDKGQKTVGVIVRNAKKMTQLIDDLLEFSRVGRTTLRVSTIDMNELVKEVLQELTHTGVSIPSDIVSNELMEAHADPNLIKIIWTNLISNAVKYSSKREHPSIKIGMVDKDDVQFYYVKDNGAGFDMQYANKLFGVFQRLHKQEEFTGTGVGLALVQRIVARHGGTIKAEAELHKGATFYFSLPRTSIKITGHENRD